MPSPTKSANGARTVLDLVPYNVEAEEWTLGSILQYPPCLADVMSFLKPEHFYRDLNRWVYQAMLSVAERGDPADFLVVRDELKRAGHEDEGADAAYLTRLVGVALSSSYVVHYARIVERDAIKRSALAMAEKIAMAAQEPELSADDVLNRVQQLVLDLSRPADEGLQHASLAVREWSKQQEDGKTAGQPTGFYDFDKATGGLKPGRLYVFAARPGQGKSAIMKDAAVYGLKRGLRVAVFTLEMSRVEWLQRVAAGETGIEYRAIEEDNLDADQYTQVSRVQAWADTAPLWIDHSGSLTPLELAVKVQREHLREPFGLVVVDYLQLMHAPGKESNRVQEVGAIARALKNLARDLNIPVVTASQMNRAFEYRTGEKKEPMLADLRESGDIEQSADVVTFLWTANPEEAEDGPRLVNLKIAKQRGGPLARFSLRFDAPAVRFQNLQRGL